MKPEDLRKIIAPVLKNPSALNFESVGASDVVVLHVSKKDMKPLVGKGGANLIALKTIIGAIDAIKGGTTKLIVDEPRQYEYAEAIPPRVPEESAINVAKYILNQLGCSENLSAIELTDALCLTSDAEIPCEVKDAISRWIQVISMNHGGRRLKLVAESDAAV